MVEGTIAARRSSWLPIAAPILAVAGGIFVLQREGPASIESWDVLETLIGWTFVGCGGYVWHRRPASRLGPLMVAAGLLYITGRVLRQFAVNATFTAGVLLGDLWSALFVWVLVSFPNGRLRGWPDKVVLALVFLAVAPLEIAWMLFWRPDGKPTNVLAIWPNEAIAGHLDTSQRVILGATTVTLTVVLLRRWFAATRPLRWALVPALVGALALLVGSTVNILDKLNVTVPDPLRWTLLLTIAMVPVAVMVGALRMHLARAGVARLLLQLRESASTLDLQAALSRALGDPSLQLAYWLPKYSYYADADGLPLELDEPRPGRARTYIDRSGIRIAAVEHDATLRGEPELLDAVTAAAGMALENGQLQAELKARLEELEGSRARIVEVGQAERKRLERNLHDGTQQRLVLLAMELAVFERELRDDPEASARVAHARVEIGASLAELRDVARGLYPAVLSTHGLRAALRAVAARAAVPVALDVQIPDPLLEQVEVAAYYVVSESLANVGKHAHATSCTVSVVQRGGRLDVEVGDNGIGGADPTRGSGLRGLRDRVNALGGELAIERGVEGGTCLRATLPCGNVASAADAVGDQRSAVRRIASSRSGVRSDLST